MSNRRKLVHTSDGPAMISGDGTRFEVDEPLHTRPPKRPPGEHTWVTIAMFNVVDPTGRQLLDSENLLMVDTGCHTCQKPYRAGAEKTRCPGPSA